MLHSEENERSPPYAADFLPACCYAGLCHPLPDRPHVYMSLLCNIASLLKPADNQIPDLYFVKSPFIL